MVKVNNPQHFSRLRLSRKALNSDQQKLCGQYATTILDDHNLNPTEIYHQRNDFIAFLLICLNPDSAIIPHHHLELLEFIKQLFLVVEQLMVDAEMEGEGL